MVVIYWISANESERTTPKCKQLIKMIWFFVIQMIYELRLWPMSNGKCNWFLLNGFTRWHLFVQ